MATFVKLQSIFFMLLFSRSSLGSFKVEVIANPSVVDEHESFSLSCFAHPYQGKKPTVQWAKDGQFLAIDGGHITKLRKELLYVAEAVSNDSGEYKCTVTVGSTTASGATQVTVKAIVTIRPVVRHVSAMVGSTVKLECRGTSVRSVIWFYKWKLRKKSSKFQIMATSSGSSLNIHGAEVSDSGSYQCQSGQATATVQLTVEMPLIPKIIAEPRSSTVAEGDRVELNCEVIGQAPLYLHWIRITDKGEHVLRNGSYMTIEIASRRTAGIYQCIARNSHGSTSSSLVTITVKSEENVARSVLRYDSQDPSKFRLAIITCKFASTDKDEIVTWSKDGVVLLDNSEPSSYALPFYNEGSALLIENVQCSDSGVYSCSVYVEEKLDMISKTMLVVQGPPQPPSRIAVEIDCTDGVGQLHVSWLPSPCYDGNSFSGYEVTVTVLNTKSISLAGRQIIAKAGVSSLNLDIVLNSLLSCSNCDLVYGVEVTALNSFGRSKRVKPQSVSSRGEGRRCGDLHLSSSVLLSYPAIQFGMVDNRCSCAKSSQALEIKNLVQAISRNYVIDNFRNLTGKNLTLSSEAVMSTDDALSGFMYIAKQNDAIESFFEAIDVVSKISGLINSDRQRQKEFKVAEKCRLKFLDCGVLFIENYHSMKCSAAKKCSIPTSLDRRRRWCRPNN